MTLELFLAILPGLLMVAAGLVGAGFLLPQTIESWREERERKKALKAALQVDRWIEEGGKVTLRDVTEVADMFGAVYKTEIDNETEYNIAIISATAAAIAYARKENR